MKNSLHWFFYCPCRFFPAAVFRYRFCYLYNHTTNQTLILMKLVYSSFVALMLAASSYAQTATPTPQTSNCYTRWEEKFEERGATEVKDGVYTDVIMSVRSGPEAQCYSGKVEV